jgi:hypothetical protein
MTPETFILKPWDNPSLHSSYRESFMHMRPAPEYASGEVVLASLYRNVGFGSLVTEGTTPQHGRDLVRQIEKGRGTRRKDDLRLSVDSWEAVICRSLASPKQPNQANRRFLQICPLVPDAAIYSLSARLATNSWNPGSLVERVIDFGEPDGQGSADVWKEIFNKLSVGKDDDIWARFLQDQFRFWRPKELVDEWKVPNDFTPNASAKNWHLSASSTPACRFVSDLRHVLALKQYLTRKQWISMFESILRIGTASHVLWLCHANAVCYELLSSALQGDELPEKEALKQKLGEKAVFWRYGQKAAQNIKDAARSFVVARAGLNLLLWHCEELQAQGEMILTNDPLSNIDHLLEFARSLQQARQRFPLERFKTGLQAALDEDPRVVACKRGISSNISEFLGHVLRQRQTSEPGMDSYDQGFFLRKKGQHSSAPWIVSLGPVSVMALVHCCVKSGKGPRTVENFCRHLGDYGIEVRSRDVAEGEMGHTLRNLGLVLDSPDAEGGMVLFSPLNKSKIED